MIAAMPSNRRLALGCVFIVGCVLVACHVLWLPRIIVDDAFISYRYSRNLVDGHGLVFNPTQRVEGYSNFLWVLATSAGMLWRLDPIAWTRSLGAAALLGSLMTAAYLARRLTGSAWWALGVALILAGSTALCGSAMGGLETGLYAFWVTAAIACAVLDRPRAASWLIGAAAVTRPEGAGLCVVAVALVVCSRSRKGPRRGNTTDCSTQASHWLAVWRIDDSRFSRTTPHARWKTAAALLLPCLLIVSAALAFRLAYFGEWLPNSVRAKSAMLPLLASTSVGDWPRLILNKPGLAYVADFLGHAFGGLCLFALVPLFTTRRRRGAAALMLASVGMGIVVAVYNFGDWMSAYRLLTPYLPILTVLVVWGMAETLARVRRSSSNALWYGSARLAAAALVVYSAAGQFQWRRPTARPSPDRELAAALTASRQPDLLAATDVLGRLGYYAPTVPILDMAGLTDAHIAAHGTPVPPFGRNDFAYVLSRRPQLIMNNVRSAWRRHLRTPAFADGYWWVDRPVWSRSDADATPARFVFVRRDSVLQGELLARYDDARLRPPADLFTAPAQEKTETTPG